MAAEQPTSKGLLWTGRVLSALVGFAMIMSGGMKLMHSPQLVEAFTQKLAWKESSLTPIGLIELFCAVLYAIPQTAVLGAILLTGYLGGAIATHVRLGDPFFLPLGLGIVAWAGLFLRDARLRELLPLRR